MTGSKVYLTGADGFVGSWLKHYLELPQDRCFDVASGQDCTDPKVMDKIAQENAVIIALHAISGIKACEDDPTKAWLTNTESITHLAELAKKRGARRFIFASSSSVYGEARAYRIQEDHPTQPRTTYGRTKLGAEVILKLADKDFEVVILRKSNVYGWGFFWKKTAIDNFIESYLADVPIQITGTGLQKRDFVDLQDVTRLYAIVARRKRVNSGVYNIGGPETISIRGIADLVNCIGESIFDRRVPIMPDNQESDSSWHDFTYDWTKAQMEWQYRPVMTIDDHIKSRMMHHIRTNG